MRSATRTMLTAGGAWLALAVSAAPAGDAPLDPARVRAVCLNALGKRTGAIAVVDIQGGQCLACVPEGTCSAKHPPGSIAKLVTAHAGLLSGRIREDTTFECRGAIRIAGRVYHCSVPGGHGRLRLPDALARSCNVWFYQAGRRIGQKAILRSWKLLGVAAAPDNGQAVSVERLAAAGEGLLVSPLEMAAVCRTIALKKDVPGSPCRTLAKGMEGAVAHGTAQALAGLPARPAGKTGSPEHSADPARRHGWFVGYAPCDRPRIAFAIFCLEGNAYSSAVPVAGKMLRDLFPAKPGVPR